MQMACSNGAVTLGDGETYFREQYASQNEETFAVLFLHVLGSNSAAKSKLEHAVCKIQSRSAQTILCTLAAVQGNVFIGLCGNFGNYAGAIVSTGFYCKITEESRLLSSLQRSVRHMAGRKVTPRDRARSGAGSMLP